LLFIRAHKIVVIVDSTGFPLRLWWSKVCCCVFWV